LPATGKTTALKQLGRTHELMVRERYPGTGRIPVVYVTTPPKGSPRKLAMEFARFLGLPPVRRGQNTTDIADAVCQVLIDAAVDLVLVDEIHNLNLATSAGEDMSDHLKYFTEHLPGHVRLRRCQRRAVRAVHRGAGQADRRPLRADPHRAVPVPGRVGQPAGHAGCRVAA